MLLNVLSQIDQCEAGTFLTCLLIGFSCISWFFFPYIRKIVKNVRDYLNQLLKY